MISDKGQQIFGEKFSWTRTSMCGIDFLLSETYLN